MKLAYAKHLKLVALLWAVSFVVFLLVYLFALAPQQRMKLLTEKQLVKKQQTLDSTRENASEETKTRLTAQIAGLNKTLKDLVVDLEASAGLIFDISQISNDTGVSSLSITTAETEPVPTVYDSDSVYEKHFHVSFAATYNQFAAFLNALERHRPVILIDTFTIARSRVSGSQHEVDMSLAILVGKGILAQNVGN